MLPFRIDFKPGLPIYEQVVYAATKSIISGQLHPGDEFPSVRALSRNLKINPNTAHKVIICLVEAGLLETRSGSIQFDLPNTRLEDLAEPPVRFAFR